MQKILVTGGNGFIGGYVVEELENRGFEPVIFDTRSPAANRHGGPRLGILGDIRDATSVTEAVAHVDGAIHLAGVLGTQETIGNPRPAAETNILGGLNVLEAVTQYNVPLVNIAVGNYWMNNTYSITKNTVERFTKMFAAERGTRVITVRALNAYGPGQSVAAPYGNSKVRKIIPSMICRTLMSQPIEVYGDGKQIMDMVYVGDVARDLVDALELVSGSAEQRYGAVLESGTGRFTSVNDIATAVIRACGGGSIKYLPMRPGEPAHSTVIADEPMGQEYRTLESVLPETVEHYHRWLTKIPGTDRDDF